MKYSSKNKKSRRYAGPELVPDLKKHNFTGKRLNCDWSAKK